MVAKHAGTLFWDSDNWRETVFNVDITELGLFSKKLRC